MLQVGLVGKSNFHGCHPLWYTIIIYTLIYTIGIYITCYIIFWVWEIWRHVFHLLCKNVIHHPISFYHLSCQEIVPLSKITKISKLAKWI